MEIVANGRAREIDEDSTVASFLCTLGWRPEWVVVELNGDPLVRAAYTGARLHAGDRVEVVRAVAGGA